MNLPRHSHDHLPLPTELLGWLATGVEDHLGGYFAWEPVSDLLWCSDKLLGTVGRTRDDFAPCYQSFRELLHPDDAVRIDADLHAHVAAGRPYEIEFRMRHSNGAYREVDSRTITRRDEEGRLWYVGLIRDITEEKTTRLALEQSERRFRQLAENIPGAVFRYVLRPDGTDGIEYMSQGCTEIFEVSAARVEAEPSAVWASLLAEDVPKVRESIVRSAREGGIWEQMFRIQPASGRLKWLQGRGTPTQLPDGSTLWNSIVLDISELRRTEAELEESQRRLVQATKLEAVGQLTGGIAHDFNNLLAVIVGNAELLEGETDPGELREGLAQILGAAQRGCALTRSLLNFARQAPLAPTSQDLREVVEGVLDLCRRTVPESIHIETQLPAQPCHVVIDRNTLENALLNLVINARDAMPGGGTLTLGVVYGARHEGTCPDCGSRKELLHEISVTDTGRGMTPDVVERVFDPFFSTKAMSEGSGLGLSMVHGFAQQSGGCVCIGLLVTDMVLPGRTQGTDLIEHARRLHPRMPILILTGYAEDARALAADEAITAALMKPAPREKLLEVIARLLAASDAGA